MTVGDLQHEAVGADGVPGLIGVVAVGVCERDRAVGRAGLERIGQCVAVGIGCSNGRGRGMIMCHRERCSRARRVDHRRDVHIRGNTVDEHLDRFDIGHLQKADLVEGERLVGVERVCGKRRESLDLGNGIGRVLRLRQVQLERIRPGAAIDGVGEALARGRVEYDRVAAGVAIKVIVAGTADQRIAAVPAVDGVVTAAALQHVVAGAAGNRIGEFAADHLLDVAGLGIAGALERAGRQVDLDIANGPGRVQRIEAVAAVIKLIAVAADDHAVVARAAVELIVAGAAGEGVVAVVTEQIVVAVAAGNAVVAGAAVDLVVTRRPVQRFGCGRPLDREACHDAYSPPVLKHPLPDAPSSRHILTRAVHFAGCESKRRP